MKKIFLAIILASAMLSQISIANTPKETLAKTVDQLVSVVSGDKSNKEKMRSEIDLIIRTNVDFETVAKRVVSKSWKKATVKQKSQFKDQFATIMVNTYFELLQNYNNEEVLYGKEQVKKGKRATYAIVDTKVISKEKKIPIRYRLIELAGEWKIYDFIVEGVSIINSYKKTYKTILKKDGMVGLLEKMKKTSKNKTSENTDS